MADSLPETNVNANLATALANVLIEHNGQDVCLMDIHEINNWTDFFIIATATSMTHIEGMERHLKEYCRANDIEIFGSSRKNKANPVSDDEWRLIDLGWAVIHLMTKQTREFYDLERLWDNSDSR